MKQAALVSLLVLGGCFSKPSFSGRDAGAGSDTGGGDDAMDSGTDAPPQVQLAFAKLSAGGRHACAIDTVGKLWCWGDNDRGQLGDTGLTRTGDPVLASATPATQGGWTDIAAGTYHTCGIRAGMVYCWGRNDSKESKPSTTSPSVMMSAISLAGTPQRVFAGNGISCAIVQAGNAYCWGAIDLGAALTTSSVVELTGGGISAWTTIALGDDHACAIAAGGANAGRLFCWGGDAHNGLGADPGLNNHHPFAQAIETAESAAGTRYLAVDATTYVTCAITAAHTLSCWGSSGQGHLLGAADNSLNVEIDGSPVWADVAIDNTFACARTMTGTVKCWGADHDGALGTGDFDPRVTALATVTVNTATTDLASLAAGESFACVLDPDGHAWCWGANRSGELGNHEIATKDTPSRVRLPPLGSGEVIRKIVAGYDFTCALVGTATGPGTAYCWGKNETKQVDSQLASVAEELPRPALPAGNPLSDIAAGELHVCGLAASGAKVTCWGANTSSQLGRTGIPGANDIGMPAALPWTAVAAGSTASCAIADGQLYCWGDVPGDTVQTTRKAYGRTPNGGSWQSLQIGSGFAVGIAIDVGETYPTMMSFGLKCEGGTGTTGTQGANNPLFIKKGTFGSASDEYATLVIAASQHNGHHTCIHYTTQESSTPRVTCWGRNESKQVNETELTCNGSSGDQTSTTWRMPVVGTQSIATANAHSCALAGSNALQCWGANNAHELSTRGVSTPGIPEQVPPGSAGPWSGVTTGNAHTCVVDDPHTAVYCWGENRHGQLGDGTRFRPSPVASGLVPP